MVLKYLIQKEFKQFLRNSFMPKLMIAFPLALMLVFPWAATQEVTNVRFTTVDHDHSVESHRLVDKIAASKYFISEAYSDSYDEARKMVQESNADIILEIDHDFGRNLERNEPSSVMISANAINGTKGSLGASYMQQIINDFNNDIQIEDGSATEASVTNMPTLSIRYLYNASLDYKRFMIPALMVMMLTMLSGFLPALNIVSEKEKGTIEQMNVSPVSRIEFILGKLIPYWIMGFLVMNIALFIAWVTYDFTPVGSLLSIYVFAIVFISLISGFGLIISNYSDTMQQAMFVMFFFMLIFMLISGLFTPVTSMPKWAQTITIFNPLKYFIQAMRMIFLKGSSTMDLIPNLSALLIFATIFNSWAIISYKKNN